MSQPKSEIVTNLSGIDMSLVQLTKGRDSNNLRHLLFCLKKIFINITDVFLNYRSVAISQTLQPESQYISFQDGENLDEAIFIRYTFAGNNQPSYRLSSYANARPIIHKPVQNNVLLVLPTVGGDKSCKNTKSGGDILKSTCSVP